MSDVHQLQSGVLAALFSMNTALPNLPMIEAMHREI